jgi:hypothetical protein
MALELTVPVAFLRNFAQPKNIGERRLIDAFFKGIAALANRSQTFERPAAVDRIVPNDDARFFHSVRAKFSSTHWVFRPPTIAVCA